MRAMQYSPNLRARNRWGGTVSRHRDSLRLAAIVALTLGSGALGAVLPQPGSGAAAAPQDIAAPTMRLPGRTVFPVLGAAVRTPSGHDLGRVVEVLVDGWGQPRAVVVAFGGFLGVGSRKVAIDWHALQFYVANGRRRLVANLSLDQLKGVPQYNPSGPPSGRPIIVVSPPQTALGALAPQSGL
jgi:PRC-barrel domain